MSIKVRVTGPNGDDVLHQIGRDKWLCAHAGTPWRDWFVTADRGNGPTVYTYYLEDVKTAMLFKLIWGGR